MIPPPPTRSRADVWAAWLESAVDRPPGGAPVCVVNARGLRMPWARHFLLAYLAKRLAAEPAEVEMPGDAPAVGIRFEGGNEYWMRARTAGAVGCGMTSDSPGVATAGDFGGFLPAAPAAPESIPQPAPPAGHTLQRLLKPRVARGVYVEEPETT